MFRLRFFTDATARTKNGQPAHSTTGVPSTSWIQFDCCWPTRWLRFVRWPPISSAKTGAVRAVPIQNRRVMSRSSGLSPCSALASTGSSAMPQMGQLPGPNWRTWGCIGQVYSACLGSPRATALPRLGAWAWAWRLCSW